MEKNYRHEYKYLISRETAELLRRRLPHFMKRDPHAGPTGQYTIRSLYFDDLNFEAFYEKVSGTDNRTKYRIRCYNYSDTLFKLERKEKKGHLTRKTAQTITLADVHTLQETPEKICPDHPKGLTEELRLQNICKGTKAMVLVDYDRTPFICRDGNTRITVDENLRTRPFCTSLTASPAAMIPVLEQDQVILEVKYDDFLPGYLADALRDIPKANMAISKFALCMNLQ